MWKNAYQNCTLCPRECGVDRTKGLGACKAPDSLLVARAALHLWEEPCLCGVSGSGTVFFSGCSLHCIYCQNREISGGQVGKIISEDRLAEIFLELQEKGAANVNLVTPTHYVPSIVYALRKAKKDGLCLPVVYNTSGYEKVSTLKMLEGLVDIYMPDCKYMGTQMAGEYSHCPEYFFFALPAIVEMLRQVGSPQFSPDGLLQKGVLVRHLVLPGNVAESKVLLRRLYKEFGDKVLYSIMSQYTPVGDRLPPELQRHITDEEYQSVLDAARKAGIQNGYSQEGGAAKESFIPPFDLEGVES